MEKLSRIDSNRPDILPLLLLVLFGVGLFFPVLFMGRAPAINDLRTIEPWRTVRLQHGEGTVEYQPSGEPVYKWNTYEGFADDLNRQFIPWGLYSQERIRSGHLPLWNPHVSCGQPLFANHQTGLTNPLIYLCYLIFPGLSAFTAIFLLTFIFSGWAMYAYLRILGLGRWPSLLAAATYQFLLGYIPTLDTLVVEKALFPLLLYSVERLVRTPSGKGAIWAVLSAVTLALVQTSCHAQEAVFISYLLGPYILFVAGGQDAFQRGNVWRTVGRRLVLAFGIFIPALLLGLVQNIPTFEFYINSTRFREFGEQLASATELEQRFTWIQSMMFVFPRLFGDYILDNMFLEHYLLNYAYIGIITILAAPFSGWVLGNKRQVWFWRIVMIIFFTALIWNEFYFDVLCRLPLFRISLQKPWSPFFFSMVVLAAHGFEVFLNPKPKGTDENKWLARTAVIVYGTLISFTGLWIYSELAQSDAFNADQIYTLGQMVIGVAYVSIACFFIGLVWKRVNPVEDKNSNLKFISQTQKSRAITLGAIGILLIILLDMWPVKSHFNPFMEKKNLYFDTVTTQLLQERLAWQPGDEDGPFRFGRSWKEILQPNTGMMYGLDDFGGYDSNLIGDYGELLNAVDNTILMGSHFIETPRYREAFKSELWDMLGVKYVLAHRGHFGQFEPESRWRPIYLGEVLVLENLDALPRMHLVDSVAISNKDDFLDLSSDVDPSVEAIVLESDSSDAADLDGTGESPGSVVIIEYLPEKVTASVSCDRRALLCFYDAWFPGWEVTVDGEPRHLEKVNFAFKGVFVDEGQHEVVFSYKPKSILYGLLGSLFGIIVTLLVCKPMSTLVGKRES
jgi:hypothetical protein